KPATLVKSILQVILDVNARCAGSAMKQSPFVWAPPQLLALLRDAPTAELNTSGLTDALDRLVTVPMFLNWKASRYWMPVQSPLALVAFRIEKSTESASTT